MNNSTFPYHAWGPKRDSLTLVIPITVIYAMIFVVGFVGNVITCIVVIRNKYMHTATNFYLLSLALSDLLLLLTGIPPEIHQIWFKYPYVFGESFCIWQGLAAETSANATVLTITAFTIERYIAICYNPFFAHTGSKLSRAVKYIVLIWITSVCCAIPQAIQMGVVYGIDELGQTVKQLSVCTLKYKIPYSFEVSLVVFFILPMSVISVLYVLIIRKLQRPSITFRRRKEVIVRSAPSNDRELGKQRVLLTDKRNSKKYTSHSKSTKKVIRMLVTVVVAFFICWAPFQAQRILAIYGYYGSDTSENMVFAFEMATYISGICYYFSTVINPILYHIMSYKFRRAFKDTIRSYLRKEDGERRNSEEIGSSGPRNDCDNNSKHNTSVCSKSSCRTTRHSSVDKLSYKGPLVVTFRKSKIHLEGGDECGKIKTKETLELPAFNGGSNSLSRSCSDSILESNV